MISKVRIFLLILAISIFTGSVHSRQNLSIDEIISLVNRDRVSNGLDALKINPLLNLAALAKASDMTRENYFAHQSPTGVDPWHWLKALGYNYTFAGENLAEGFMDAEDLESSWMKSPSHRANILSPNFSEAGLAVASQNHKSIVVQFFGSRDAKLTLRE